MKDGKIAFSYTKPDKEVATLYSRKFYNDGKDHMVVVSLESGSRGQIKLHEPDGAQDMMTEILSFQGDPIWPSYGFIGGMALGAKPPSNV